MRCCEGRITPSLPQDRLLPQVHFRPLGNYRSWYAPSSLQVDGCGDPSAYPKGYNDMGAALEGSGRQIVYSCSWPAYLGGKLIDVMGGTCRPIMQQAILAAPQRALRWD